jgi:arsenate reductase
MKMKLYYLGTCSTNKRIMSELGIDENFPKQEIKTEKITEQQIDEMARLAGSYEALFSRVAMKYRSMGLGEKNLTQEDYKQLILEEYTFLKRPVFIIDNQIFVGNSKKTVEAVSAALQSAGA